MDLFLGTDRPCRGCAAESCMCDYFRYRCHSGGSLLQTVQGESVEDTPRRNGKKSWSTGCHLCSKPKATASIGNRCLHLDSSLGGRGTKHSQRPRGHAGRRKTWSKNYPCGLRTELFSDNHLCSSHRQFCPRSRPDLYFSPQNEGSICRRCSSFRTVLPLDSS